MIPSRDPPMFWCPWFRWVIGATLAIHVVRAGLGVTLAWPSLLCIIVVATWLGHDWGVWAQRKTDRAISWSAIARVVEHTVHVCARGPTIPWGARHLYGLAMGVYGVALLGRLNERERRLLRSFAELREPT